MTAALSEDQAAVYDRQLRVWGVEVQRKLTSSRVAILGFGQLAAEVAKNITLAGVGSVTLVSDEEAKQFLGRNFLITTAVAEGETSAEAAAKILQAMNPLVKVSAAAGSVGGCSCAAFLKQFDLVLAMGQPAAAVQTLDALCAEAGVQFMAAGSFGPSSYFFIDLHHHSYLLKKDANDKAQVLDQQTLAYPSFAAALSAANSSMTSSTHPMYLVLQVVLALEQQLGHSLTAADLPKAQQQLQQAAASWPGPTSSEELLELLSSYVNRVPEFAPVCAVVGGVVANNVIRAVSHSGAPVRNFFFYSLFDGRGLVEDMLGGAGDAAAAGGQQQQKRGAQQNGGAAAAAEEVDVIEL